MKKLLKVASVLAALLFVGGLAALNHYGPVYGASFDKPLYVIPPSPERYGKVALEIMERTGYYVKGKQWLAAKEVALEELKQADSYEETYPIIEEALMIAGGKHSFLLTEKNKEAYFMDDEMPTVSRNEELLYVKLPSLADAEKNGIPYAERVLSFFTENQDVSGIVIDLRDNNGGDMGPMLTAVSPLLPDGEILSFAFRQHKQPVILEGNTVRGGGTTSETSIPPFKLKIPVAVLVNEGTGSSGEAVLTALMDLENVQTFGQPSAGYASGNTMQRLYDGAVMLVTGSFMQTPSGLIFGEDPIPVDHETEKPLEDALEWLNKNN